MHTKGFFNIGQVTTHFIFSQMSDNALQPPGPGLENGMDPVKTVFTGFLPQFAQDLITGIAAVAKNIDIVAVRIARDLGDRVQTTGADGSLDILIPWITRIPGIIW